jgi:hypothetical protein
MAGMRGHGTLRDRAGAVGWQGANVTHTEQELGVLAPTYSLSTHTHSPSQGEGVRARGG